MADNLLDMQVDADHYAETAAGDIPSTVDRTHVSEEQFQRTKEEYRAKIESGNIYLTLPIHLPPPATSAGLFPFAIPDTPQPSGAQSSPPHARPRLSGKNVQLIASAAAELYYFAHYERLLVLLAWLREGYDVQTAKLKGRNLDQVFDGWDVRCRAKMDQRP